MDALPSIHAWDGLASLSPRYLTFWIQQWWLTWRRYTHARRFGPVDPSSLLTVQTSLLEYVQREYTSGDAEGQLFCQSHYN